MKAKFFYHHVKRMAMTLLLALTTTTVSQADSMEDYVYNYITWNHITFTCPTCGKRVYFISESIVLIDLTCTCPGYVMLRCSCGASFNTNEIPPPGSHDWGGYTHTDATCTEAGGDRRTCNLCGATETANPVPALGHSEGYDGKCIRCSVLLTLMLENGSANATAIYDASGKTCPVKLRDRTLYSDGDWNTLCLPFDMDATQIAASPLAGATVMELDGTSSHLTNNTLTLNFKTATTVEAGKPYIVKWPNGAKLTINTEDDWNAFAQRVEAGETFAGKNVLLNADINVSTMVGTEAHPFCGIFEGAGHTLNLSINEPDEVCAAPFRYINGATIRNVKVTGTVNGGQHCAGLVGAATGGTNSIHDCWMAAAVTSQSYVGGVLGNGTKSTTTILNCLIYGSLTAPYIGIFYGWGEAGGIHAIENCYAMGTYNFSDGVALLMTDGVSGSVTGCYHNDFNNNIPDGEPGLFFSIGGDGSYAQFLGNQWGADNNNNLIISPTTNVVATERQNPVFADAIVDGDTPAAVAFPGGQFVGTYDKLSFTDENRSILFLGADNKLYYPLPGAHIGACRAYFDLGANSSAKSFIINFDGEEEVTSIGHSPLAIDHTTGKWYDISGRRLSGKPTQRGIYIHNGKKIIVK